MGQLQANMETGWDGAATALAERPGVRFARPLEAERDAGRHEPQNLIERIVPRDPYAVWLEQRERDRERERERGSQVRWVHRPRGGDGGTIVARRL
jgi:hypothetical protein